MASLSNGKRIVYQCIGAVENSVTAQKTACSQSSFWWEGQMNSAYISHCDETICNCNSLIRAMENIENGLSELEANIERADEERREARERRRRLEEAERKRLEEVNQCE